MSTFRGLLGHILHFPRRWVRVEVLSSELGTETIFLSWKDHEVSPLEQVGKEESITGAPVTDGFQSLDGMVRLVGVAEWKAMGFVATFTFLWLLHLLSGKSEAQVLVEDMNDNMNETDQDYDEGGWACKAALTDCYHGTQGIWTLLL